MRLARGSRGQVEVDPSARAPGRGAYVHRRPACMEAAGSRGALARALHVRLSPEDLATLMEAMRKEIDGT